MAENLRRYGAALLAAIVAILLYRLLTPILDGQNPYHTAWAAVVFSAWYCGVGPAVVTVLLDMLGIWYWFLPPAGTFQLANAKVDIPGMLGFLVFSGFIVALGEANRRSLAKSRLAEGQLRSAHAELERKVQERTAELSRANENLRELSGHLQQLRDEERRQIARELHDSVGQLLAAMSMNIAALQSQSYKLDSAGARAVSENSALVQQIGKEIRTISHLLHPPLLDVAGLASAVRWYVDGFSERSKIKVDMEIPGEFRRLPDQMEITIFRLVQECLTNIHRHSGSDSAKIAIREEDDSVIIEVKDAGKGISLEKQLELSSGRTGVGFRGMRERLRQFGGDLDIQSDSRGTCVKAKLPVQPAAPASEDRERAS
ncbi:MAG TPA: sensor histidine kinase [Terriglobales bacterium]